MREIINLPIFSRFVEKRMQIECEKVFSNIQYLLTIRRHWRQSDRGNWSGELFAHGSSEDRTPTFRPKVGPV